MKTVLISSYAVPGGNATSNRLEVFASELINNKVSDEVRIISANNYKSRDFNFDKRVILENISFFNNSHDSVFIRFLTELFMSFKLWSRANKTKPDLVIVTIPSMLLLLPVVIFAKPKKLVLDIRDLQWDYFSDGVLLRLYGSLARWLFGRAIYKAKLLSVTNRYECKKIEEQFGIRPIIVMNGISKQQLEDLAITPRKDPRSKVYLSYIGNVGLAQELDILLDLAKSYKNQIEVNIVGKGVKLNSLMKRSDDENISNVNFRGSVSKQMVAQYIKNTDILFAQIGDNYKSAVPSKIFEYIASGRSVLLGLPSGVAKEIFIEFKGVEIFPSGNFPDMIESFENLLNTRIKPNEIESNIRILKSKYIRENNVMDLICEIKKI